MVMTLKNKRNEISAMFKSHTTSRDILMQYSGFSMGFMMGVATGISLVLLLIFFNEYIAGS